MAATVATLWYLPPLSHSATASSVSRYPLQAHPPCLPRHHQAFAGIVTVSVGHCHPEVNKAVIEQTERLQHTTVIYLNNQIAEYAKELTDRMPGNLKARRGGKGGRDLGRFLV